MPRQARNASLVPSSTRSREVDNDNDLDTVEEIDQAELAVLCGNQGLNRPSLSSDDMSYA